MNQRLEIRTEKPCAVIYIGRKDSHEFIQYILNGVIGVISSDHSYFRYHTSEKKIKDLAETIAEILGCNQVRNYKLINGKIIDLETGSTIKVNELSNSEEYEFINSFVGGIFVFPRFLVRRNIWIRHMRIRSRL